MNLHTINEDDFVLGWAESRWYAYTWRRLDNDHIEYRPVDTIDEWYAMNVGIASSNYEDAVYWRDHGRRNQW